MRKTAIAFLVLGTVINALAAYALYESSEKPVSEARQLAAYHEAGHVIADWFNPLLPPVSRVTIVPNGNLGGATTIALNPQPACNALIAEIVMLAAGDEGQALGGFRRDRETMKSDWDRAVNDAGDAIAYCEGENRRVTDILDAARTAAFGLILAHREGFIAVAKALLEKDTLTEADLTRILGARTTEP